MSVNKNLNRMGFPKEYGLYNPKNEHENCGFGFIANIKNEPKHEIVHQALEIVHNLDHRGAVGSDPLAGDGAGILIQIPDLFFRKEFLNNNRFKLIEGDIRDIETCQSACMGQDFILHQAALGSVPRSLKDPISSNEVNVSGFLNMLVAARDKKVKRFIFAASSSTYGDSKELPKIEDMIGKPLSPYAITKYVNELLSLIHI